VHGDVRVDATADELRRDPGRLERAYLGKSTDTAPSVDTQEVPA
jgi:hypothetical protein